MTTPLTGASRWGVLLANCADCSVTIAPSVAVATLQSVIDWVTKCSGGAFAPINAGLVLPEIVKLPGLTSKYWSGAGGQLYPNGDVNAVSYLGQDLAPFLAESDVSYRFDFIVTVINMDGHFFAGYSGGLYKVTGCLGPTVRGDALTGFSAVAVAHEFGHQRVPVHTVYPKDGLPADFNTSFAHQVSNLEIMGTGSFDINGRPLPMPQQNPFYDPPAMELFGWNDAGVVKTAVADGMYYFRPVVGGFAVYVKPSGGGDALRIQKPQAVWTYYEDTQRGVKFGTPPVIPPPVVTPTKYALTVNNGTGDGSYEAGKLVAISANPAPRKMKFSSWTGPVPFTNRLLQSTTLTMPALNITVQANYVRR